MQLISATNSATLRYSASVEDLEIVCCFLDCQEIISEPRNKQKPELDHMSSISDAQSTLERPTRSRESPLHCIKYSLCSNVQLMYLSMHFTAF